MPAEASSTRVGSQLTAGLTFGSGLGFRLRFVGLLSTCHASILSSFGIDVKLKKRCFSGDLDDAWAEIRL